MNRLTTITLVLVLFGLLMPNQLSAQVASAPTSETPEYYLQKKRTNNTIAWVCLGTGQVMAATGFIINLGSWGEGNTENGLGLAYAGIGVAVLSVPFFISAGSNKRKAKLALKGESIGIRTPTVQSIPSAHLSLQIPLD